MWPFTHLKLQLPWKVERPSPLSNPRLAPDIDLVAQFENQPAAITRPPAQSANVKEGISLGAMSLDADDYQYRRLTTGQKVHRRDLSPLAHDRMLEIAWFLWEGNPFARRLIGLMKDLCLGEGLKVMADDERIQEAIDKTWNHPINQLASRTGEFFTALSLSGELIIPAAVNPVDGRLTLGFIEPYQVKDIVPVDGNVLIANQVLLKADSGEREGKRFKVIRHNPETGFMDGEVFLFQINKLPNSLRGRSDLMPLADWLDLYDQYMFAEVERLHLLSSFVWDYTITGEQDEKAIQEKVKKLPKPKPGQVFGHNEKEKLEARTPDLKAQDRSEVARLLRVHIAGSFGFPLSYLGEIDSNRATIEGQNDILLKTPSARQKEFGQFINQVVAFGVQNALRKNPALFKEAQATWKVRMPEIAAKDIARVGGVLAQVATALDTSIANETMSKKTAIVIQAAIIQHLGVDIDPQTLTNEIGDEGEERQARADDLQADLARASRNPNPPIPSPEPRRQLPSNAAQEGELLDELETLNDNIERMNDRPLELHIQPPAVHISNPVTVHPPGVTVHVPRAGNVVKETVHHRSGTGLVERSTTTERPADD